MFLANTMPPITVVNDLFFKGVSGWGGTNRISWEKFYINVEEYNLLCQKLGALKGYALVEVPAEVDTSYKWFAWQNHMKHGIPYEGYIKLLDEEKNYTEMMEVARKQGDDDLMLVYHLEIARVAEEIQSFLDGYIKR